MKTTELVVTKCKDCTFSSVDYDQLRTSYECLAPVQIHQSYDIEEYYKANISPYWCPLKQQDLLITFKK